jgi:hypothetical protein
MDRPGFNIDSFYICPDWDFQPGNFIGRTELIEIEKEERPWPIA